MLLIKICNPCIASSKMMHVVWFKNTIDWGLHMVYLVQAFRILYEEKYATLKADHGNEARYMASYSYQ